MYVKEVERLHKVGIYTDEMYNKIMDSMKDCGTGQLVGVIPGKADLIYNLKFNPDDFNLVELVVNSTPWLGADHDYPELFGKYGYTFSGIGDGFRWYRKDPNSAFTCKQVALNNTAMAHGYKAIDDATELELWKMLALLETYWCNSYIEWYNHKK